MSRNVVNRNNSSCRTSWPLKRLSNNKNTIMRRPGAQPWNLEDDSDAPDCIAACFSPETHKKTCFETHWMMQFPRILYCSHDSDELLPMKIWPDCGMMLWVLSARQPKRFSLGKYNLSEAHYCIIYCCIEKLKMTHDLRLFTLWGASIHGQGRLWRKRKESGSKGLLANFKEFFFYMPRNT